jgi:hypothetical protein
MKNGWAFIRLATAYDIQQLAVQHQVFGNPLSVYPIATIRRCDRSKPYTLAKVFSLDRKRV